MIDHVEIKRLASALGAEVTGLDLAKTGPEDVGQIRQWLGEFKVLLFPEQTLSASEHVDFGSLFGELEGHPHLVDSHQSEQNILELTGKPGWSGG